MKRVVALLLCLVLVACSFIACDETETKEPATHVHTYAETWSSDAEGHWYDATCTCTDAPLRKLAHTDANNDGACDVCTFSNHTHTYAEGWTADCTNHWRAADCGHIVAGTDVQAHADTNEDGKCDTCAYVIEDIHTHYYATAWSHDADNHWHAALCEHSVEVADKAAHEINAAGVCTVCQAKVKEVDAANLGELLAASVANNHKVVSGKVMYAYTIPEFDMTSTHAQYYTLGNGSTYVNREQYEVSNQSWYQLIGEDEVFGVTTYDGGYTLEPVAVGVAEMGGYTYTPSTLLAGFENTSSLSETLYALYTLSQNEGVSEYTVKHNAATKSYSFSYTYLIVNKVSGGESLGGNDENPSANVETYNTSLFTVDVKFTYDENYVITTADFIVGAYNEAIDGDYSYDPTTGKVTLVENAYADTYTYNVYQTAGERTYSTEYPKASIVPSAFNLSYKDEIIGEKVTVDAGVYTQFSLTEILPLGALINFIEPEDVVIEVKNDDAQAAKQTVDMSYSNWSYTIGFNANSLDYVGTYTVTVSYAGNLIKTFKMEIKTPAVGEVLACVFENQWGWDGEVYTANEYTAVTNATLEAGEVLDFVGLIKPTLLAQNYTVKVIDENDADVTATTISKATLADAMVFYEYQASYEAYRFSTDVAGTYKVIVTSTEDTTVSTTLTVTVEAEEASSEAVTSITLTPSDTYTFIDEYTYVATVAGTYTFTVPAGYGVYSFDAYNSWSAPEVDFNMQPFGGSFEIALEAGEEFGFYYGGLTKDEFTIEVDVPVEIITSITLTPSDTYTFIDEYTYVAAVAGTYTFTVPAGYGVYSFDAYNSWGAPEVDFNMQPFGGSFEIALEAGEEFGFYYGGFTKDEFTIEVTPPSADSTINAVDLQIGYNSINAEDVTYAYTATADGQLVLSIGSAIMGDVTITYTVNGGTEEALALNSNISLDLVSGDEVIITVVATGYATLNADWTASGSNVGSVALEIGNNAINAENITYTYTAAENGTLDLSVGAAIMGDVTITYTVNGGTEETLALNSEASLDLEEGDTVVITIVAAGYATLVAAFTAN